jgi:hypothetical protein
MAYGRAEVKLQALLTSALDRGGGVYGRIILQQTFRKWDGGMDRIYLAQERDRWRAVVYAAMNI